jgi:hypothetical protein
MHGTMRDEQKPVIRAGEIHRVLSRLTAEAFISLFAVFAFSVVQLIRHGFTGDYPLLLAGSVLSVAGTLVYGSLVHVVKHARNMLIALAALGGWIPLLFGAYLFFYRGFWRLKGLFAGFSVVILFEAACFILVGYAVLTGTHKVSQFVRKVKDSEIIIE